MLPSVFVAVYRAAQPVAASTSTSGDWIEDALDREGMGRLLEAVASTVCAKPLPDCSGLGWDVHADNRNASEAEVRAECDATCGWAKQPGGEARALVARLIERQRAIEVQNHGSLGMLGMLRGAIRQEEMLSVGTDRGNGGSAPSSGLWCLLPYHVSSEAFRSGVLAAWRYDSSRSVASFDANLVPVWARVPAQRGWSWFTAADLGLTLHTRSPWLSALDLNVAGRARWDASEVQLDAGGLVALYLALNKLRLGAMWYPTRGNEVDVTVGVSDLAGLISLLAGE